MTLGDLLPNVLRMLGDMGGAHVTIARADEHAYQVRFTPDSTMPRRYRVEGRRWMDGEATPTRGTEAGYTGWARWSTFMGFGVDSVIATDWSILR